MALLPSPPGNEPNPDRLTDLLLDILDLMIERGACVQPQGVEDVPVEIPELEAVQ